MEPGLEAPCPAAWRHAVAGSTRAWHTAAQGPCARCPVVDHASKTPVIQNIQALRCLAAVLVLLAHLPAAMSPLPDAVAQLGFAGVDLFFVISGFIMAETTRDTPAGWHPAGRFVLQRFARIYIGWWPFFVLYLLGSAWGYAVPPHADLWKSFFLWPQDVPNYLLAVTWSLSFELYFYLGLAGLILCGRRHAPPVLALLGLGVVLVNLWAMHQGLYAPENEGKAKSSLLLPFYLSPLVLEFIGGFLLSGWLRHRPAQSAMGWLALCVLLLAATLLYQTHGALRPGGLPGFFHTPERVALVGGGSIALVAFAVIIERRGIVAGRMLQSFGDASYCFYLAHIFFVVLAGQLHAAWQPRLQLPEATWGVGTLVATLLMSQLFHRTIERPLNKRIKILLAGQH